jgi:hypothetical protein
MEWIKPIIHPKVIHEQQIRFPAPGVEIVVMLLVL